VNVYNKTIEPSSEKSTSDFLFWWLAPILALLVGLGIWSNHFECGFHTTDIHTIVNNEAIDSLRNIPRFFVDPRTSADQSEYDNYQPLLTTTFSIDYHVADKALPQVFQIDTFVWFLLQLAAMYLLFSLRASRGGNLRVPSRRGGDRELHFASRKHHGRVWCARRYDRMARLAGTPSGADRLF
jgi:hypothetical protein